MPSAVRLQGALPVIHRMAQDMKLITKEIAKKIPALYATENLSDEEKMVWVKLFTPDAQWTWYIVEYDPSGLCFGIVDGLEKEIGYFDLRELETLRGPLGLRIERDLHFKPTPMKEIMESY